MYNFSELAHSRRSIRKFTDEDVSIEDIKDIISVAASAPSGCNSQCWNFVVITDKSVLNKINDTVIEKLIEILQIKKEEITENYMASKKKMIGFFTKAPVVIAVFMTDAEFYDTFFISALKDQNFDQKDIMDLFANYDLLSIGAAVQNLLLAAHEKGLGACWMNEPAIAGKEINRILEVTENQRFVSLIPIGYPAYVPREKKLKELDEILKII